MGFFDIFGSRDRESHHISMPSKPKSPVRASSDLLETMEEPEVPKPFTEQNDSIIMKEFIPQPAEKSDTFSPPDTHSVASPTHIDPAPIEHQDKTDQEGGTIFEIPDFKEGDLKIDVPDEIIAQEPIPSQEKSLHAEPTYNDEPEQEIHDLPMFETSRTVDLDTIRDEIRTPIKPIKIENKEVEAEPVAKKIEMYIEKNSYLNSLIREEEVISEVKHITQDLNRVMKYSNEEKKIQGDILDLATDIKDTLLAMDVKLFEEG